MGSRITPIYGLVLSGGKSRRFGCDKAGVEIDGQALLERTVTLVAACCERVYVSVRADQADDALRCRYEVIADDRIGIGPAAGILAAHARFPDVAWFVVACDLPLLDDAALRRLVEVRRADKAATGYRNPAAGFPEPLCAIWEPATLENFRRRAEAGRNPSPRELLAEMDTELIDATDTRVLENLNTQADFERLGLGASRSG